MSRVGLKSISLPEKVTVKNDGGALTVEGPKGKLEYTLPQGISLTQEVLLTVTLKILRSLVLVSVQQLRAQLLTLALVSLTRFFTQSHLVSQLQ